MRTMSYPTVGGGLEGLGDTKNGASSIVGAPVESKNEEAL